MERLIEEAARLTGRDAVELRRRNMVRRDEMPWSTPMQTTYDDGDFHGLLDRALASADWAGFDAPADERGEGLLRGRGLGAISKPPRPRQRAGRPALRARQA